ncbi:MAG: flippase-like domain-containing protein, partial [Bacteroidia bacterium]|nr:flippase-like domain-containing protein [Bacteroidia bacterium]
MNLEQPYIKNIITGVKFVLVPVTFGFIFYKLFYHFNLNDLFNTTVFHPNSFQIVLLAIVVLLMCLNWFIESIKWQYMLRKAEPVSLSGAVKAVLSGVTFNLITPNQLGNFAGRVLHLKSYDKWKGSLMMVICHTAQVIITASVGLIALLSVASQQSYISQNICVIGIAITLVLTLISLALYVKIDWISKLNIHPKINPYIQVFSMFNSRELAYILWLSAIRYVVFVMQYYLLIKGFGVEVGINEALGAITATFFAQSFIPGFLLVDLGMRGASA